MEQQSYFKNAAILTVTGFILRLAGMGFRVYLAGQLGSEGMGLYQLIFSIYNLSIAAATAGVSVAGTTLIAEELSRRDGAVLGALRWVLAAAVELGCTAALVQLLLAGPAAAYWLGDPRAELSLKVLAPSLPFMAAAAALRGYFLGRRRAAPGARAQLIEQAVRILLVIVMIGPALRLGIRVACAAVMLADTISEILSCLCMYAAYRRDRRCFDSQSRRRPPEIKKRLNAVLWPVEGSRCTTSALQAAENMLVPACLTVFLGSRAQALSQYGALKGMAIPVLFFPFSFLSALSTLLVPEITAAHVQGHRKTLERLIGRMMFLTMTISVLVAGLFTVYAPWLGELLYHDEQVGVYLRVLGPLMPCMYLESMVDGVLKGLGQQMAVFRYGLWDSLLRIGGVILLLPRWGMMGFLAVMLASNLFTCTLNTHRMLKSAQMKMRWVSWSAAPLLALLASALAGKGALTLLPQWGMLPSLVIGAGVTAVLYTVVMLPLGLGKEMRCILEQKKRQTA